jgi:hypothetical protein
MDDIDIGGIDEILKQAARIRNDAKCGYLYNDVKPKHIGSYKCNGCGEENSLVSSWCFRCGLRKFGSPPKLKMNHCYSNEGNAKCNVYNTDQVLQSKSKDVVEVHKPREINTTKNTVKGEVKVFEYDQSSKKKQNVIGVIDMKLPVMDSDNFEENVASESDSLECPSFSTEDIILYDRCESKKSKKRLYIKPMSTPSLTTPTFSPTVTKNAWSTPGAKQARPSSTPLRIKNVRPNSASKVIPQNRPNSSSRKQHSSTCSKKSLNSSLAPSVFERLYNNETKPKIRPVQSSPQLITTEKNKNTKTNTVMALPAPQLRLVPSFIKYFSKFYSTAMNKMNNKIFLIYL